ncbi:MAG: DUF465 domain-containing protein [Myxococcota bacterium]
MTLEHHPLINEFPELRDAMHRLKVGNPEFRALFDEYHDLDKQIYRIEQDIEPVSDDFWAELKRRRLYLKDRLLQMMHEASARGQ